MTQLDIKQGYQIEITQESEVVPILVEHEVGKLMTGGLVEVGPVVGGMGQPEISHKLNIRERFHNAISPKRPVEMLNDADTNFSETRSHHALSAGALVGFKPLNLEEVRIAKQGIPAKRAARRSAVAVKYTGHHY